jgi:fatty acid synthase
MLVAEKHKDESRKGNVIDVIMSIMAIRDRKQISMESSLSKLGIDSLMGVEILQVLERDFDLILSSQELRSLTLNQIEKLAMSKKSGNVEAKKVNFEIEKLLSGFGNEETSSEVILKINKLNGDKKILVVPGFEGMVSESWIEIAERLEVPTYALQLAGTAEKESIDEVFESVKNVSKILKKKPLKF